MDDIAVGYPDKLFHGHGTQVAIVAGGCKTGVARKANLYLIKTSEASMRSGLAESQLVAGNSVLYGFYHVVDVLLGGRGISVPKGKAIVLLCSSLGHVDTLQQGNPRQVYDQLQNDYKNVLGVLDSLGATVIMAAGNYGGPGDLQQLPNFVPQYIDNSFPQNLGTADSPVIMVGSTNGKGQLSYFSSPGRGKVPVSLYAQGEAVSSYDFITGPRLRSGTSFAAPIVVCALDPKSPRLRGANMIRLALLLTHSGCLRIRTFVRTGKTLLPVKIRWECV